MNSRHICFVNYTIYSLYHDAERIYSIAVWGYDVINLAIVLLFKSGCRPGEAVAATNENLSVSSFNVDRTEIELRDAAGRTWYEITCRAKTDAGYRDIPIPESASWIIKRCRTY